MRSVTAREANQSFSRILSEAEAGEEIVITRRGKVVARLMPPETTPPEFPDLTEFRASIKLQGESLSRTVVQERREARY